jgi:hypothetical protein
LLLFSTVFSEEVTNALPQTGSNRAGGTYIAYNEGVNALFGNPAGLSTNNKTEIIIGYYWQIHKTSQFDDKYYSRWNDSYSINYKHNNRLNYMGLLYLKQLSQYPFKFAGAIGFSPFYNWKSTRFFKSDYSYVSGTSEIIYSSIEAEEKIVGLYDLLCIGIGFSWESIGAIGASLNYPVRKQYEYESHSIYVNERNGDRKISEYNYKNSENVSADQFLRIGGILHISSRFSLGILWMQAHRYSISDQEREFPGTINFGIAYRIFPRLLLAFDIQSRPWEKVKIENEYLATAKNGNAYRFGVEYENKIILRAGYGLDILPITDSDENIVELNDITLGIGYKSKHFVLDIGTRYRFTTYKVEKWANIYDYNIREIVLQSSIKLII